MHLRYLPRIYGGGHYATHPRTLAAGANGYYFFLYIRAFKDFPWPAASISHFLAMFASVIM